MSDGWLKLHRKIMESPVFDNPNLLKVWLWCLCKATHTCNQVIIGKQIIVLQPGQFVFGRLKAAEALKMNDRTVYDYMKMLQKLDMICLNPNNKYTLVTIVNWGLYQSDGIEFQQQNTQQHTIESTQQSTIKNHIYKNVKKEKKEKKVCIPPSVDEVKAYCAERKNEIDAECFVSFYESKGWMIGKNKIKDWKAAIRTWERNNKQKGDKSNGFNTEQRSEYDKINL